MAVNIVPRMRQPQQEAEPIAPASPLRAQTIMGLLFLVALLAFEIFNFDTTRFALVDFLGDAHFAGLRWATVLAIAFCAIDFAGLLRFFLPQEEEGQMPAEVWYLMGAWLLGATMNALMTWWAVNLALLNHDFGNEVLSRQQLLEVVPIFVATLVWITRILFIGAFTVAGGYLFNFKGLTLQASDGHNYPAPARKTTATPLALRRNTSLPPMRRSPLPSRLMPVTDELPVFLQHQRREGDSVEVGDDLGSSEGWHPAVSRRDHASVAQER